MWGLVRTGVQPPCSAQVLHQGTLASSSSAPCLESSLPEGKEDLVNWVTETHRNSLSSFSQGPVFQKSALTA